MLSHPILANPSVKGDHPYKGTLAPASIHPPDLHKAAKMPLLIINHLQYKNRPVNKKNRHYGTPGLPKKVTKSTTIDNQSLTLPNTLQ
jgi:hypothetical protein